MTEQGQPQGPDGELLSRRRPVPSRQFGDNLRRHLLELEARSRRPRYLWLLIAAYTVAGILLLVLAAAAVGT
jgi:hypothetical protein